jgi:hypothetical protein
MAGVKTHFGNPVSAGPPVDQRARACLAANPEERQDAVAELRKTLGL